VFPAFLPLYLPSPHFSLSTGSWDVKIYLGNSRLEKVWRRTRFVPRRSYLVPRVLKSRLMDVVDGSWEEEVEEEVEEADDGS
jgi:hypothetical protein